VKHLKTSLALGAALCALTLSAQAAEWSDTSIGLRSGSAYREPVNSNNISKTIVNLTHVSGYKYGTNFFNADMLMSNNKDSTTPGTGSGAQEVYVVYRNTIDFGKVQGKDLKSGLIRGWGATVGFDYNTKSGDGYNSKKRMLVAGPTMMLDVPGFLNVSLLELWESNFPTGIVSRYSYKPHTMINLVWGVPMGAGWSFEGYANFIASKGKNEFGGNTAAETNIDAYAMYDLSGLTGGAKNTWRAGVGYQYWKNKFGNDNSNAFYKGGAFAKTPSLKVEYHF
jgi:hypothetical protein